MKMQHSYVHEILNPNSKRTKEHKTHKLPLNTCTRDKEHTKLTLNTCYRAKSKRDQVASQKSHNSKSQIYLRWSLVLVHRPWKWCTPWTPPGRGWRATFDVPLAFGVDPPKVLQASHLQSQNQEREWATVSTLGLAQKESNHLLKSVEPSAQKWG
jgi:hypothetical protein